MLIFFVDDQAAQHNRNRLNTYKSYGHDHKSFHCFVDVLANESATISAKQA